MSPSAGESSFSSPPLLCLHSDWFATVKSQLTSWLNQEEVFKDKDIAPGTHIKLKRLDISTLIL